MKKLSVKNKFIIHHPPGTYKTFAAGDHVISDELADDFHVKVHVRLGEAKVEDIVDEDVSLPAELPAEPKTRKAVKK